MTRHDRNTQRGLIQVPLDRLRPWARNARTHSKKQVRQIADSIEVFGFTNPVLIDQDRRILQATAGWRPPGSSA